MAAGDEYDRTARGIQSVKDPTQVMGSDPVNLAGNAEITITYEPDYDLNVEGFRAPTDAIAEMCAISGMRVGPVSVMAGPGLYPLSAFNSKSELKLGLALPVTGKAPLKVTIRNMTSAPITGFYLGVHGKVKRAV